MGEIQQDPGNQPAEQVTISQEKLQEIIDKAFARGARNSKDAEDVREKLQRLESLEADYAKVIEEVEQLRAAKSNGGGGEPSDAEKRYEEQLNVLRDEWQGKVQALSTELSAAKEATVSQQQEFRTERLRNTVVAAAAKHGARDPDDVFLLMHSRGLFTTDEESGDWVVLHEDTKKPRLDVEAGGEYLSLDKAVAEFLESKPHHKRGSGRTGAGQGEGAGSPGHSDIVPLGGDANKALDLRTARPSEIYANRRAIVDHLKRQGSSRVA